VLVLYKRGGAMQVDYMFECYLTTSIKFGNICHYVKWRLESSKESCDFHFFLDFVNRVRWNSCFCLNSQL